MGAVEALRRQAAFCSGERGSPLYAHLLEAAAADVDRGGPIASILEDHHDDPEGSALALRMMGSVHRLVLEGAAPELAEHYPSVGGHPEMTRVADAFQRVVERHDERLRTLIQRPVQTNEPGRSAALVGGFLVAARETGLPLRVLEIGASAGLNLRWDAYRYEADQASWGDPASPVRFSTVYVDGAPPFDVDLVVTEREGCDLAPIDPTTPEGELTLLSYVWADQENRIQRLRNALKVARRVPVSVDRAPATEWLAERLDASRPEVCTIVFHSIVEQYLTEAERVRVGRILERAGHSSADGSLAHLTLEPRFREDALEGMFVTLRFVPGGEPIDLARASAHGDVVHWLGS